MAEQASLFPSLHNVPLNQSAPLNASRISLNPSIPRGTILGAVMVPSNSSIRFTPVQSYYLLLASAARNHAYRACCLGLTGTLLADLLGGPRFIKCATSRTTASSGTAPSVTNSRTPPPRFPLDISLSACPKALLCLAPGGTQILSHNCRKRSWNPAPRSGSLPAESRLLRDHPRGLLEDNISRLLSDP